MSTLQLLILHLAMEKPGITLQEIQEELLNVLLVNIHISNICRFLHQNGFTRQKLRIAAVQRDEFLRQQYISEVSIYSSEMLIFLMKPEQIAEMPYGTMATAQRKSNCESSVVGARGSPVWHSFYIHEGLIRCESI